MNRVVWSTALSLLCAMDLAAQITIVATGKQLKYDVESQKSQKIALAETGGQFSAPCAAFKSDITIKDGCKPDLSRSHSTPMVTGCDAAFGQAGPGYGFVIGRCNTHTDDTPTVTFDSVTGHLTVDGKVCRDGGQRGSYEGTHFVYQKCPSVSEWTEQYTFSLPNVPGWQPVATLPAPPEGVENVQYAIAVTPPSAASAGLFDTDPSSAEKGTHLWAKLNPTNDLRITGLEVTQGIQNLANEMPLVAKRRTIVRAYVSSTEDNVNGVGATLAAFRNGIPLGAPIPSENFPAIWKNGAGQRMELEHAFWFQVPPAWREKTGEVRFVATVDPGNTVFETNEGNNTFETTVAFSAAAPIRITAVPFHMHEGADRSKAVLTYSTSDATFQPIVDNILRFHPTPDLQVIDCGTPVQFPTGHALGREWDLTKGAAQALVLYRVARTRSMSGCGPDSMYWVGLIHPKVNTQMPGFNTGGIAVPFRRSSWVKMSGDPSPSVPWRWPGGAALAHELGHNVGLPHVSCMGDEGFPVWDLYPHPSPDCRLAVGEDGYFGMDVYFDRWGFMKPSVISNNPAAPDDKRGFPLMGYRPPEWADPFDYCLMLLMAGVPCNPLSMAKTSPTVLIQPGPPTAAPAAPPKEGYLIVGGVYDLKRGQFEALDVSEVPNTALNALVNPRPTAQTRETLPPLSIAQLDAKNSEIVVTPAEVLSPDGDPTMLTFLQTIPKNALTRGIRLRYGKATLGVRMASKSKPTVRLVTPNRGVLAPNQLVRWTAGDADGDALTFNVLYSTDSGRTWRPLATGLTEMQMTLPEAGRLPGSVGAVLRVEANDGFHTTRDDSDTKMSAPTWPPVASIVQGDGTFVDVGRSLMLDGVATDVDEGSITNPDFFRWFSDRDGAIGSGRELQTRTLSRGVHAITLQVRDSEGKTASATRQIYVGVPPPFIPPKDLAMRQGGSAALHGF
jgi:hypothetical protein